MEKLIQDNYNSIVARGMIDKYTTTLDFIEKIQEEVKELEVALANLDEWVEETVDVILVCFNLLHHYEVDIEAELKAKIKKNWERAKNENN